MATIIGEIKTVLTANTAHFRLNMKRARDSLVKFKKSIFSLKTALLGMVGLTGFGMLTASLIRTGAVFERTMAVVRGVSRATAAEFKNLTEVAREMGATTEWTANQAAEALKFLSMAGFSSAMAIKALPDTLNIATAGAIDLGRAADITTNVLTAMQLPVEALSHAGDVLIGTITRTNTDMNMLAESMKYAAPMAKAFGYELEEVSSMIGILGNAGVQGSMAGTQLAFAMQKAQKIAQEMGLDSSKLTDVLMEMKMRGYEAAEVMQIFGMRGGRAALILKDLIPQIKNLEGSLRDANGEAMDLAKAINATVIGAWRNFKSALESLTLDAFDRYKEGIREFLTVITTSLREFGKSDRWAIILGESAKFVIGAFGALAKSIIYMMKLWNQFRVLIAKSGKSQRMAFIESTRKNIEKLEKTLDGIQAKMAKGGAKQNLLKDYSRVQRVLQGYRDDLERATENQIDANKVIEDSVSTLAAYESGIVDIDTMLTKLTGTIDTQTGKVIWANKFTADTTRLMLEQARALDEIDKLDSLVSGSTSISFMDIGSDYDASMARLMVSEQEVMDKRAEHTSRYMQMIDDLTERQESATDKVYQVYETLANRITNVMVDAFGQIAEGSLDLEHTISDTLKSIGAQLAAQGISQGNWYMAAAGGVAMLAGSIMGQDSGPSKWDELEDLIGGLDEFIKVMEKQLAFQESVSMRDVQSKWLERIYDVQVELLDVWKTNAGNWKEIGANIGATVGYEDYLRDWVDPTPPPPPVPDTHGTNVPTEVKIINVDKIVKPIEDLQNPLNEMVSGMDEGIGDNVGPGGGEAGTPGSTGPGEGDGPADPKPPPAEPDNIREWINKNIKDVKKEIAGMGIYAFFDYLKDLESELPDNQALQKLLSAVGASIVDFQNELTLISKDILSDLSDFAGGWTDTRSEFQIAMDESNTVFREGLLGITEGVAAQFTALTGDTLDTSTWTDWESQLKGIQDLITEFDDPILKMFAEMIPEIIKEWESVEEAITSSFHDIRMATIADAEFYMRDLAGGVSEVEKEIQNITSTFDDWIEQMKEAHGDIITMEEAIEMQRLKILKDQSIGAALREMFYEPSEAFSAWSQQFQEQGIYSNDPAVLKDLQSELADEFHALRDSYTRGYITLEQYYAKVIPIREDQWEIQKKLLIIEQEQRDQLEEIKNNTVQDLAGSVSNMEMLMRDLSGAGENSAVQSVEAMNKMMQDLVQGTLDAPIEDMASSMQALMDYVPDYLDFMGGYTGDYASTVTDVMDTLKKVQQNAVEALNSENENWIKLLSYEEQIMLATGATAELMASIGGTFYGSYVPGLKTGGIAQRPTMIGEGNLPELVTPLTEPYMSRFLEKIGISDMRYKGDAREQARNSGIPDVVKFELHMDGKYIGDAVGRQITKGNQNLITPLRRSM